MDSGLVQLPGMRHGLSPAATASVLATSACWDELVGGDARSHGRPGLGVVPVVMALSFAQRDSLERSLLALMLHGKLVSFTFWFMIGPATAKHAACILSIGIELF